MYTSSRRSMHPTDPISRIMVWPVATMPGEASLLEVAESLASDGIGALGVVENGHLAGVVSERDVVTHLAQGAKPEHVVFTSGATEAARPMASATEPAWPATSKSD